MISLLWTSGSINPAEHEAIVSYISRKIGAGDRGFGECRCMAAFDDAVFLGAVVFHNYEPMADVIEISAAAESKRWLGRQALEAIFSYAFRDCGCQMVVARISEENKSLHRIFHAYGFTSFVIPRLRGRNEDERIFTLTDDAWKQSKFYRSDLNGQAKDTRAA
ncbi:GNAT family protein [Rhizobium sp. YJ-22]|uniref:GNAT family N-acetyltransferase n=1 Tax=Rhizobium sp. YJ-22 TaxID=3037556 RepID=UPI00241218EB|nr:GNAT family protein [Rhizobium sp. YJ-22]MDG3577122.1 GNAT family protein [Rhizobium sp. YJ-22]